MNINKISLLIVALFFSNLALSQTKIHKQSIPILTSGANGFAYLAENPDGVGGSLHIAKIVRSYPLVRAKDVATLENYNTGEYMVYDFGTSPDNRYLVSYEIQSYDYELTDVYNPSIFSVDEMDIRFYDMGTGEYLGYVDDIPYGYLDESRHPSVSLEEYRQAQIAAGVPPEVVAEYDYIVNNEHSFIDFFDLHWNTDGTVSVSYLYDVYLRSNFDYIGSEIFTINYTVNASGVALESYGNIKTAAAFPAIFDLSVQEPVPGDMQFESRDILFPYQITLFPGLDLTLYRPKKGAMITGSIPARYWNF